MATVAATGKGQRHDWGGSRVGSRVSGRVQRLHANIGDVRSVPAQVIAELEKDDQQALLEQRRAEFKVAEARLSLRGDPAAKGNPKSRGRAGGCGSYGGTGEDRIWQAERAAGPRTDCEADPRLGDERAGRHRSPGGFREARTRPAKQRYIEDLRSAKAQIEQSAAAVRVLEAQVEYATIRAPIRELSALFRRRRARRLRPV